MLGMGMRFGGLGSVLRRFRGAAWLLLAGAALAQPSATQGPLTITGVTPVGTNVPPGRQIVLQFNRPVVPIGRMERTAEEIPIEITPALACQWRWLNRSALACQLGNDEAMRPATHYTLAVNPGITAEDGTTTEGVRRYQFTTERPRVTYASFATWRGPGTPVIRAVFTQPVGESSVREHLYFALVSDSASRVPATVEADTEDRVLPRFIRPAGEPVFLDFGERQSGPVDDRPTPIGGETARRVWLLSPSRSLAQDATVRLRVEPGLEPAVGAERGDEDRVVVEFQTYPEFRFLGVTCRTLDERRVLVGPAGEEARRDAEVDGTALVPPSAAAANACNPLGGIGLAFSAPVLASEIKAHVTIDPDLAGGRSDYDPWANSPDYTRLGAPHRRGRRYVVGLPERLRSAEAYHVTAAAGAAPGPRDEFGRSLAGPIDLAFATDHRPPDYTLVHPTAVLEARIDSEVPLYVTNLASFTVRYRRLDANGREVGLTRTTQLPAVADVQ